MNNNVVEKTLKSIDNIDRLSDLAAISIYNTSHEAIDKFDVMQEHATPEYVEGEFVQESLLTGVLIGAGIIGVAISAFLIIKKIIESKAKGDPNAASNTVAGVNLLSPEEINKLFDGWNDKYFKNHPDLVVEGVPGADVGEMGRYNDTLSKAIRGFCDNANDIIDGINDDTNMREAIDELNKEFDSSINMDELVSKTGRVDKDTILQIKTEAGNISKTLREFDAQVTKCINEFRNKEKNNQNSGSDSEENKISEENIKLLEKILKAKAATAGTIMTNFRNKCLGGIEKALDAKVKEITDQAKAKQQQTRLEPEDTDEEVDNDTDLGGSGERESTNQDNAEPKTDDTSAKTENLDNKEGTPETGETANDNTEDEKEPLTDSAINTLIRDFVYYIKSNDKITDEEIIQQENLLTLLDITPEQTKKLIDVARKQVASEGTSKTEPENAEETPANETEKKDETSSENTEEKSHDLDIQYSMGEDGKRHIRVINNGETDDTPIYWPEEFDESANKIIKAAVARGENINGFKPVFGAISAVNQIYLLGNGDLIKYLNFEYSVKNTDNEYRNSKYEICKFIAEVLGEPPVDQLPTPPTETSEEIKDEESPKTEENESGVKFNNDDFEKDVKERVSKAVAAGIDETAADMVVRAIKMDSYANIENALLKGFSMNKPEDRERYMALYDNLDKALAFFNHGPLKTITENRINEFMTPDEVRNKYKNPENKTSELFTEEEEDKLVNASYEVKGLDLRFRREIYNAVTDDGFAEAAKKLYAKYAGDENKLKQINTTLIAMAKSIGKESEVPALPTTESAPKESATSEGTPDVEPAKVEEPVDETEKKGETPSAEETTVTPEAPKEDEQSETSSEESNGNDIKKISDSTGLDEGKVEGLYKILKDNSTPDDVKRAFIIDTIRPMIHMPGFNQKMANDGFKINYDNFKKVAEAASIPFEIEQPEISEKDINDIHTIISGTDTEETKLAKIADNLMNSTNSAEGDKEQELLSRITNGPTFAAEVAKAVDAGIPKDYARTVLSSLTMSDDKYSLIKERLKDYDWLNDFKQREAYKKAYNHYNDALLYFTDKGIRDIPELKDELPDPTVEFPNALNDENVMQRVLAQYPVNPETLRKDLEYFNTHIPDENLRYIIKDIIPKYFLENDAFTKSFEETVNQIRNDDIKVLNLALINANIAEFKPSPEILKQVTDYINANLEKLKSRMTCTILADALVSGTFDPGMIDEINTGSSPESTPEPKTKPTSPSNSSTGSGSKQPTGKPAATKQRTGSKQQPARKPVNKSGSGSKQQSAKKPGVLENLRQFIGL